LRTSATEVEMEHREPITTSLDNEKCEYTRMLLAIALYNPPPDIAHDIKEAYDSKDWRWQDCDGCTAVSELHSPPGTKFWPCVRHDYDCWRSAMAPDIETADRIRAEGDRRFYRTQRAFGVGRARAALRVAGVRAAWWGFYRWLWRPFGGGQCQR